MRILQIGVTLFSLILLADVPTAQAGKQYAVLVGVEEYEHSQLRRLHFSVDDVDGLSQILKAQNYTVTLLTDDTGKKDKSLEPTRVNIEKHIERVLEQCRKDDTIILAFAGHGLQFTGQKDAYFCPVDARPFAEKTESLVSVSKIYRELEQSLAGVKVIFVDACRNDPDPGRGRGGLDADAAPRPPRGVAALFSCSAGQIAFEHDTLKHGVFFHYVLEGLKSEAADRRGRVTFSGLSTYVRENVPVRVRQLFPNQKFDQFPNLKADLIGVPPVLARVELNPSPTTLPKKMTPPQKTTLPTNNQKTITNSIGMELKLIPAGEFMMGSPESEQGRDNDEALHKVNITKPFYLATTEVTQKQWQAVMGTTPWQGEGYVKEGDDYPATYVSWNDAQEFIKKLNEKEGTNSYRLPTEAEWEYACRAGSKSMYTFGDSASTLKEYAWFDENAREVDEKYAHRVGLKRANGFGLFDMHGNVWEWCNDRYGVDYYKNSAVADPRGPSGGSSRVLRGGSWYGYPRYVRSAHRGRREPDYRGHYYGFRVLFE